MDSLRDFKRNNAFKQIDLPRYYLLLTTTGRMAVRLRLHHRWVDRVPEPVIATMRELRNVWNKRRLGPSKGAT